MNCLIENEYIRELSSKKKTTYVFPHELPNWKRILKGKNGKKGKKSWRTLLRGGFIIVNRELAYFIAGGFINAMWTLVVVLSFVSYISWKGEKKIIFVTFCLASNPLWCCMFKLDLTSKNILQDVLWYWVLGFRQSHPQPVYLKTLFVHLSVGVRWRPGKWPVALGDAWLEQWL